VREAHSISVRRWQSLRFAVSVPSHRLGQPKMRSKSTMSPLAGCGLVLMRVCEDTGSVFIRGSERRQRTFLRFGVGRHPPATVSRETPRARRGPLKLRRLQLDRGEVSTEPDRSSNGTYCCWSSACVHHGLQTWGRLLTRVATEKIWQFVHAGGGSPHNDAFCQNGLPLPALQAATFGGSCPQPSRGRTRTV
jgi:hypothetical protein